MDIAFRTRLFVVLGAVLLVAPLVQAADHPNKDPHVRPTTSGAGVEQLLAEAMRRSATVRSLVEQLDRSDLVVYVQTRPFKSRLTTGHLIFVSAAAGRRYVVVEIACGEPWNTQLATLGHELHHAVEIADAEWIQSSADMAVFYTYAGMSVGVEEGGESFETRGATEAGRRVARELNDTSNADSTRLVTVLRPAGDSSAHVPAREGP
jgi:hypothetical protein